MNYIRHLTAFYQKIMADARLNPTHVSLYHALFQLWNLNRFENPVSINRTQVLHFCKIGSYTTFYKCMYDLHNWGYINYLPSHNPFKGSLVHLYIFETTNINAKESTSPESQQAMDQQLSNIDSSYVQELYPSINSSNNTNKTREENTRAQISSSSQFSENEKKSKSKEGLKIKRKKIAVKKEKDFIPPSLHKILDFFQNENYAEKEGRKFYYHYAANGWKVSGKSPMKNWEAAAHSWMLKTDKFNPAQKPNSVIIKNSKNYDEPL
jgi:hypothetical protein